MGSGEWQRHSPRDTRALGVREGYTHTRTHPRLHTPAGTHTQHVTCQLVRAHTHRERDACVTGPPVGADTERRSTRDTNLVHRERNVGRGVGKRKTGEAAMEQQQQQDEEERERRCPRSLTHLLFVSRPREREVAHALAQRGGGRGAWRGDAAAAEEGRTAFLLCCVPSFAADGGAAVLRAPPLSLLAHGQLLCVCVCVCVIVCTCSRFLGRSLLTGTTR